MNMKRALLNISGGTKRNIIKYTSAATGSVLLAEALKIQAINTQTPLGIGPLTVGTALAAFNLWIALWFFWGKQGGF